MGRVTLPFVFSEIIFIYITKLIFRWRFVPKRLFFPNSLLYFRDWSFQSGFFLLMISLAADAKVLFSRVVHLLPLWFYRSPWVCQGAPEYTCSFMPVLSHWSELSISLDLHAVPWSWPAPKFAWYPFVVFSTNYLLWWNL